MLEQTAARAADSLFSQGVLGTVCVVLLLLLAVLGWTVKSLYGDIKALNSTTVSDREKLITAQQAAAVAADKVVSVLEAIKSQLGAQKDANEDLTKQVELAAQETRHSLNNVSAALNGIANRLERDRDGSRGRP